VKRFQWRLLVGLTFLLFGLAAYVNFSQTSGQHFTIMAESFLQKRWDMVRLDSELGDLDTTNIDGKYYWHQSPFPAVVILPLVWGFEKLGLVFYQGYLQIFISLAVFWTAYKIGLSFKYKRKEAYTLAFAFVFSSIYAFVSFYSQSWYYNQTLVTLLLLWSVYEFYTRKRYLLIGTLLACVLATRITGALVSIFFILEIIFDKSNQLKQKLKNFIFFVMPIIVTALLLLGYNYVRFGSWIETGYGVNKVSPDFQEIMKEEHGMFRLENIPTNFYWYFLAPPRPILEDETYHLKFPYLTAHGWGMSFFFMSPIFIRIFLGIKKKMAKKDRFIWITSLITLLFLLSWYSAGFFQVGPRYMLDFLPLWFILLLASFKNQGLRNRDYLIIVISALTNLFFVWTSLFPA
jgi:hypothetical protein